MSADAIGLDIGGANVKAATASGRAACRPFELWRHPDRLADELAAVRNCLPDLPNVAVTMTGELCDCFPSKRDGVRHILAAARQVFADRRLDVWTTNGTLVPVEWAAEQNPLAAAAANWLALAEYAGRLAPRGPAVLIDTGSTTTDIVPLRDGRPAPAGRTDPDRLRAGELVYTGARRTPVCAVVAEDVAAEVFATAHDAYVLLGMLREEPENRATADGRPATADHSHWRLARMLGGDAEVTPRAETLALARRVYERQRAAISAGIERVAGRLGGPPGTVILAGSGEFLARAAWDEFVTRRAAVPAPVYALSEWDGPSLSEVACAYALAVIAAETSVWS
jgi:probable H4MPT-linked C1 transfer pathway protein